MRPRFMRLLLLLPALLLLLLPLVACDEPEVEPDAVEPAEPETMIFSRTGLTFAVDPGHWTVESYELDPNLDAELARLVNPPSGAYLDVRAQSFDAPQSAEDLEWIVEDKLFEVSTMPDYREISRENVEFLGVPAIVVEFSGTGDGVPWRFLDYNLVRAGDYIGVQLAAPEERWAGMEEQRRAVLDTFHLPESTMETPTEGGA